MRTIGLLLDSVDVFENDLISGALEGLRGTGFRLVCIVGGALRSPLGWESKRNLLYQLLDGRIFDGFLVSGALSHYVSYDELARFCLNFAPVPIVTISVSIPGFLSSTCDNVPGFSALLDHLIGYHRLTRLAFVGGPPGQQESEIRKNLFLSKVEVYKATVDPGWIVDGDYTFASGRTAAETLVRHWRDPQGALPFDALVSANDAMAAGVLERLREFGIRIPQDLIVTGFDGNLEWSFTEPRLTTVFQDPAAQATGAARCLVAILRGENPDHGPRLNSKLLIRESCGCALAKDLESQSEVENQTSQWRLIQRLRELSETLQACGSLPELLDLLSGGLVQIGAAGFWLTCFAAAGFPGPTSRLLLSCSPGQTPQISPSGIEFPAWEWLPGGLAGWGKPPQLLIIEALHSRGNLLGCLLYETDWRKSQVSSIVRSLISESLQSVLLLEERRRVEQQLIESAKLTAMRRLIVGVAHEINTPLGVALTGTSFLFDQIRQLKIQFEEGRSIEESLTEFLEVALSSETVVLNGLTRASGLVMTFKQVSVDPGNELRCRFSIQDILQTAQVWFHTEEKGRSVPRSRPVDLLFDTGVDSFMDSYPWAFTNIVTSLISNTLVHGFPNGTGGLIRIFVEETDESVVLVYTDDGVGMGPLVLQQIFEPFFSTRRSEGHIGLGLYIVFNQITGLLGGSIHCTSEPGQGVQFEVMVPKSAPLPT